MNIYKFLLVLMLGLSSITACSDLEEEPIGLLAPESFFTSLDDVQAATNGAFGHMLHRNFMSRELSMAIMLRSDMVDFNPTGTQSERIQMNDLETLADNAMQERFWPQIYLIIGAANEAIAGAEYVDADQDSKNAIVAQAYFARAFAYFHLVRLYGDIPYLDEPVTDLEAAGSMSKSPVAKVYENIIEDLEFAKTYLPATQVARSIPAKSAASAYLALAYLTMGDYQNAYTEAKEIIDNAGTYNLALEPDFQDLYDASLIDNSLEPIFVLDFIGQSDGDQGRDYLGAFTGIRADEQYGTGGGWSVLVPTLEVFNNWDSRDYRKAVSFDTTAIFNGVVESYTNFAPYHSTGINRPHIAKYVRGTGSTNEGNGRLSNSNYLMMRYAEVLLIAAEAAVEIGNNESALTYVNMVRARARNAAGAGDTNYPPSSYPEDITGTVTVDEVLEERRLELAFEGKRWYDIVRRQLGDEVFSASGFEGEKVNWNSGTDYLLPLPADELSRNPNLLPQNPGY
ncbi:RagB/SusD family nutrient uptake outer membrane protein [Chondrinema litorale]|uniref:RagB/SusD family nutrient uptake outer membrane protein n=1 Tax=Chondrinema litorale TaxID=2994555 RepID=UPI002542D395|nr:RagB/SusD family nutrient uptake outer membrane protein [Chondrinema litorale]UZR98950.1 RagB/SusD family nutrient uptake outer membrane protein [Chondrinema litorale]